MIWNSPWQEVAIRNEQSREPAETVKCPNCNKDFPLEKQTRLIKAENEITHLRQELQLKITTCQDLEEKIQRMHRMQKYDIPPLSLSISLYLSFTQLYSAISDWNWINNNRSSLVFIQS